MVRFHNLENPDRSFAQVLKWLAMRKKRKKLSYQQIPAAKKPHSKVERGIRITFINHSTLLIQWEGKNLLTDPIWSKRASPFRYLGPKRLHAPGIPFEQLPPIDMVLLSHNHYDHMDLPTLEALRDKFNPLIVTGLGNKAYLKNHQLHHVRELAWWETFRFLPFELTFTPAEHFSARWPWDKNKTLWGGFFIRGSNDSLYFAGDTGYGQFFKKIEEKLGSPSLAFLPIGAYKPRWFMQPSHLSPEEAIKASHDLKAKKWIPIHFGTFNLAEDTPEEAINLVREDPKIIILHPGESYYEAYDL